MKKNIYVIFIIVLFIAACKEKVPPIFTIETNSDKIVEKDESLSFDIKMNSETIFTNFSIIYCTEDTFYKILDSNISVNSFEFNYILKIPDSSVCLCEQNPFSLIFQATQEDNSFISKQFYFVIDNYNPVYEKRITLYSIDNTDNNAGYFSIINNKAYTPDEAINYDSDIDFGLYSYFMPPKSMELLSPINSSLMQNYQFGTANWDSRKNTIFETAHISLVSENEYLNIKTDNDILAYDWVNYPRTSILLSYQPERNFFLFYNKQYKGIFFIADYDNMVEYKADIWMKYFINCDSLNTEK